MSSFVGRVDELAEISRLLRQTRLLTVVGPAGVGKTRLAAEMAGQLQRAGRGEVVLVELALTTRGDAVPLAIAAALGLPVSHGDMVLDVLVPSLTGREMFLVLDNCEHALDDCGALLGTLLTHLPELRVLATSRESLRVPGEIAYPLQGLSSSPSDYLRSDAVRLFVDRARAVVPDLELTGDDAAHVAEMCRSLDGLPLAIELAARLVRAFPLADIRARLDDRLSLLTGGWRTADRRHHDLRTAIAWSYELLSPVEQVFFRRLSVLPADFGADVAALLVAGEDGPGVLELLTGLEAKSLLTVSPGGRGPRFRMLESIRLYGQEQLAACGEEVLSCERVVEWLTRLAAPLLETVTTPDDVVLHLTEEHDNLAHFVDRLSAGRDDRQALLAAALVVACVYRAQVGETTGALLDAALERTSPESDHRSIALGQAALIAMRRGRLDESVRLVETALGAERRRDRTALVGRLLRLRYTVRKARGDHREAMDALLEAFDICRRIDDRPGTVLCLNDLAWTYLQQGAPEEAQRVFDNWPEMMRFAPLPRGQAAAVQHTRATLALEQGNLGAAEIRFADALRRAAAANARAMVANAFDGLAVVALLTGRHERGYRLAGAADKAFEVAGLDRDQWSARRLTAAFEAAPKECAAKALADGRKLGQGEAVTCALDEKEGPPEKVAEVDPLSPRDWNVIELVTKGLTNRQIAARLYLSVRTVETHLRKIRDTLGLRSRAHVAAWAVQRRSA